eukprot:gb/GECG01004518.1/.p1 GENE.gb/GECG01004518.1/~~gb/GECG01004518.1/.p1  ORF type:complete len:1186 (+),score=120.24 gb/GECG01004518.1/:1-3558(+)
MNTTSSQGFKVRGIGVSTMDTEQHEVIELDQDEGDSDSSLKNSYNGMEEDDDVSMTNEKVSASTSLPGLPTDEELNQYADAFDQRYVDRLRRIMLANRVLYSNRVFESRKIDQFHKVMNYKKQMQGKKHSRRASIQTTLTSEQLTGEKEKTTPWQTIDQRADTAGQRLMSKLFPPMPPADSVTDSEDDYLSDDADESEDDAGPTMPPYHRTTTRQSKPVKLVTNHKGASETVWLKAARVPFVPPTPPMQAFVRLGSAVRGGEQPILRYCPYFGDNEDVRPLEEVYILNLRPDLVSERENQLSLRKRTYIACACLTRRGVSRSLIGCLSSKLGSQALRSLIEFDSERLIESANFEHQNFIRVDSRKQNLRANNFSQCPLEATFWNLKWENLKKWSEKAIGEGLDETVHSLPISTWDILKEVPSMRIDFPAPYKVPISGARYKRSRALYDKNSREYHDLLRYAQLCNYLNDETFDPTIALDDEEWCRADGRTMSVFKAQICRQSYMYADSLYGPFPVDDLRDQFSLYRYAQLPTAEKWNEFIRESSDPKHIRDACNLLQQSMENILQSGNFSVGNGCGPSCYTHDELLYSPECRQGNESLTSEKGTAGKRSGAELPNVDGRSAKSRRLENVLIWTPGLAAVLRRLHAMFRGYCCAISQAMRIPCWQVALQLRRMGLSVYAINTNEGKRHTGATKDEDTDGEDDDPYNKAELSKYLEQDVPESLNADVRALVYNSINHVLVNSAEPFSGSVNTQRDKRTVKYVRRRTIDHVLLTMDVLSHVDPSVKSGSKTFLNDDAILPVIKSCSYQLGTPQDIMKMRTRQASVAKKHLNERISQRVYPAEVVCHHVGPCSVENECACMLNQQFCSKFCSCSIECLNKWHGCACGTNCRTKGCPCVASDKECDPDMCHRCGAHTSIEIACGASHVESLPYANVIKKAAPVTYGNTFETTTGGSAQDEYQEEGATGENAKLIKKERYSTTFSSGVGLLADLTKWRSIARAADRNAAKVKVLLRHCSNVNLRTGRKVRLLVGQSSIPNAGFGLFAGQDIEKGELVEEYQGEIVSQIEAERRGSIYDFLNRSYIFDLNDDVCLDATRKGNKMRFANHSKSPNCYARKLTVSGRSAIGIFAAKHIYAHEELFFNYNYDKSVEHANRQRGAAVHVGWLKDGRLAGKVDRAGLKKKLRNQHQQ